METVENLICRKKCTLINHTLRKRKDHIIKQVFTCNPAVKKAKKPFETATELKEVEGLTLQWGIYMETCSWWHLIYHRGVKRPQVKKVRKANHDFMRFFTPKILNCFIFGVKPGASVWTLPTVKSYLSHVNKIQSRAITFWIFMNSKGYPLRKISG